MATSQPRQPKGQPVGGQFAGKQQTGDEVGTLESPVSSGVFVSASPEYDIPRARILGLGDPVSDDERRTSVLEVLHRVAEDERNYGRSIYPQDLDTALPYLSFDQLTELTDEADTVLGEPSRLDLFADHVLSEHNKARSRHGTEPIEWIPEATRSVHGYGPSAWEGAAYDTNGYSSITDTAKKVRALIKEATGNGYLPADVKYSVRSEKFAGGRAIHVSAHVAEHSQVYADEEYTRALANSRFGLLPEIYTVEAVELNKRLESIANQWNMQDIDTMTDYFRADYYTSVSVNPTERKVRL